MNSLRQMTDIQTLAVSPDQKRLAFFGSGLNDYRLWILDLTSGRGYPTAFATSAPRNAPVWDRSGRQVVVTGDEHGDENHRVYAVDIEDGSVRPVTESCGCAQHVLDAGPDNRAVVLASTRHGPLNLYALNLDAGVSDSLTHVISGVLGGGRVSADGTWVAYVANEDRRMRNTEVFLVRADGSELRRVLAARYGVRHSVAAWAPDGRQLAVTSDEWDWIRPGVLDCHSGAARWFGGEGSDETAVAFSRTGGQLLCLRSHESEVMPVIYDLAKGDRRDLAIPRGVASSPGFVRGDAGLVFIFTSDQIPPSIVQYDLKTERWRILVACDAPLTAANGFVSSDHVWYHAEEGTRIPALLYRPASPAPTGGYPALLALHGGPTSQWLRGFDLVFQFLVSRGYVVLAANVRGSTGYGATFRNANVMDWGGRDMEDAAAAAEYLGSLPYVNCGRIGVLGGSYGGFLALMTAVKRPQLWKAVAVWSAFADLKTLYDEGAVFLQSFLRRNMGSPHANADLWRERSPIHSLAQLQAPLLIVHGVNDPRCPLSQALRLRDRLLEMGRREGEEFDYAELGDEGHGAVALRTRFEGARRLASFFGKHL